MNAFDKALIESGISAVNRNYSLRDIQRTTMMRTWKNHLEMYLMRKQLNETLLGITSSISWIWKFCSPKEGKWDPKFDEYVNSKIKEYPLAQRDSIVEYVIEKLDRDEVEAYCFNMEKEALGALRASCKPFEQTVVQPTTKVGVVFDRSVTFHGTFDADGKPCSDVHKADNVLSGDADTSVEMTGGRTPVQLEPLDGTYKYVVEPREIIRFTYEEVNKNDVYTLGKRLYSGIHFPFMLYACPGSGKTTFNLDNRLFLDTDLMYLWPLMNGSPFIITNMPNLLEYAAESVAIIPSLGKFRKRCGHINGYEDAWYYGMLEETRKWAKCRIFSDLYLSEIPFLREFFSIDH